MDEVGLRELRQDLSRYVRRAGRGKRVVVTERGRPVAMLTPLPRSGGVLEQMIAEGRATPPKGDLADLGVPRMKPPDDSRSVSNTLEEDRADRDL
jgi:prevent-host-death family protein